MPTYGPFCDCDMENADTCAIPRFQDARTFIFFDRIRYRPSKPWMRCPDCNVADGGYHHPGCTFEVCPSCGGAAIDCNPKLKR